MGVGHGFYLPRQNSLCHTSALCGCAELPPASPTLLRLAGCQVLHM